MCQKKAALIVRRISIGNLVAPNLKKMGKSKC